MSLLVHFQHKQFLSSLEMSSFIAPPPARVLMHSFSYSVWKSQLCACLSNSKTTTMTKCFQKLVVKLVKLVICRQKVVCRHSEPSRRSSRSSSVPPVRSSGTCGWTSREHARYETTSSWTGVTLLIRSTALFCSLLHCYFSFYRYVAIYNSFIHHDQEL